jgi:hypothetical protein
MHIVAKGTPAQRRAERLASVGSDDNRVSFGCVNVQSAFFMTGLGPDFWPAQGIVCILPEKTMPGQMFGFQPAPTALTAPVTAVAATQAPGSASTLQLSLHAPQVPQTPVSPVAPVAPTVNATAAGATAVAR